MRFSILLLLILLSGCSTMQPKNFQLKNTSLSDVWPSGSEIPRYRYVGELHGESLDRAASTKTIFEKMIGLMTGEPEPLMLKRPYDLYVSPKNILYIADLALPGVMVFNLNDKTMRVWDEVDNKTSFQAPVGVVGTENEILVVDTQLAKVFRFSEDGTLQGAFGSNYL
ncbi:MAG TPA: hypothetical protein EYP76_06015, partial [Thiomicrorhabdus sp.]|nr:hypothetical protein [Thiomicrorhabdus sp.]